MTIQFPSPSHYLLNYLSQVLKLTWEKPDDLSHWVWDFITAFKLVWTLVDSDWFSIYFSSQCLFPTAPLGLIIELYLILRMRNMKKIKGLLLLHIFNCILKLRYTSICFHFMTLLGGETLNQKNKDNIANENRKFEMLSIRQRQHIYKCLWNKDKHIQRMPGPRWSDMTQNSNIAAAAAAQRYDRYGILCVNCYVPKRYF